MLKRMQENLRSIWTTVLLKHSATVPSGDVLSRRAPIANCFVTLGEAEEKLTPDHSESHRAGFRCRRRGSERQGGTLLTASDEALAGQQGYIYESDRQLLTVWFPRASSNIDIQVTLENQTNRDCGYPRRNRYRSSRQYSDECGHLPGE